jgi:hypothetical protein
MLYHLVFGYKIFDKSYYDFLFVKYLWVFNYSLFVREYLQIYGGNETIQKSSFLNKLFCNNKELFVIYLNMNYFNIIVSQMSLYLYYIYIAS